MENKYTTQIIEEGTQRSLLNRWKPLLEASDAKVAPINSRAKATITAVLLENQYKYMKQNPSIYGEVPDIIEEGSRQVNEDVSSSGGVFTNYDTTTNVQNGQFGNHVGSQNNDFYAKGDARIPNTIFPMIRRTFPELLAHEICGVQPMSSPVSMAYALRFKYDGKHLADFTPDGGSTSTGVATVTDPQRTHNGAEAGHNLLNTAHTGTSSADLVGLSATDAVFQFTDSDKGVAKLLGDLECSTALPQMTMEIEKTAVEAGTRKLALKYSLEIEQDLQNMHGIKVEDEMTTMMSYEIQAEIDRELLIRQLNVALTAGKGRGWSTWNPANADGRWSAERAVNLWQTIRVQARLISLRNRRGSANYAVVTPYVVAILEILPNFKSFTIDANVEQQFGNAKAGTLGSLKVFVDTRSEAQFQSNERATRIDYILLGYKGSEAWDSGLIYLPYIPVMMQKTMGPNDFSPRVGIATRYAIAANLQGAENYYHCIIIKGLTDTFSPTGDKQFMV